MKHYLRMFIDKMPSILSFIFYISIIGGCIYVFKDKDDPPIKNHDECSYVIYFDTTSHKFKSKYLPSVFHSDSLVNFTDPYGQIWWQKNFASDEDRKDDNGLDYDDITLKNGSRYKVTDISEGGCKTTAIEDSLHSGLANSNDNDTDN